MEINQTEDEIATEIFVARAVNSGLAFVLVEGDTDSKLYGRFSDEYLCKIIPAHGKEKAIHVLEILEGENLTGVLAIVDADFWRLEGKEINSSNLFITDTHDLETMILESPALKKLLLEFGSASKIEKLTQQLGKNIREILLDSGIPIGYLRWVSQRESLSLKFEDLTFSKFIDDKMTVSVAKMITTVKSKSIRHDLCEKDLADSIDRLANVDHNPWDVCCGHDLLCILFFGFRKALGSKTVRSEEAERSLRLAYEEIYFSTTHLYGSLKAWEKANQAFQIFRAS